MNSKHFVYSLFLSCCVGSLTAAPLSLTEVPLYLGASVKPNVMLMLDNSGSMKQHMFDTGFNETKTSYNNTSSYFGLFDETLTYKYNTSIPVNPNAFNGSSSAPYNVAVDTSKTGAFYATSCNPAVDTDCWSGNYLNWLTTRRIDATRAVLIGGKLESRTAYNYGTIGGTTYNYKIVAQNEPDDRRWSGQISNSSLYTPIPDSSVHDVFSPAHESTGGVLTTYDPYAKIRIANRGIYNSSGVQIGEVGTATADENWETISFSDYTNPVVVANPSTFNGGDPGTVVIRNVDAATDTFEIAFFEWEYRDGGHADEDMGYIVLESGTHTLPGGARIVAGTHTTNTHFRRTNGPCDVPGSFTSSTTANYDTVSLPTTAFSAAPVVITSVTTVNNDPTPNDINTLPVTARVAAGSPADNEFRVALQQEEALSDNTPLSETISYVAIEPTATPIVDATNNWTMSVGTQTGVTHADSTFNLGGVFTNTPTFIANMITSNGVDTSVVRLKSLATNSVTLDIQEEQSCDSEQSHGAAETVGYIAVENNTQEFNIAIVVENEPVGLLQDISQDVRLGVSFYRFPEVGPHATWGIYNGVTTDGGTLRFKIPNNPFVSFPDANGGYRDLSGYITTPIENIVDAVEHYPLVWGTTPLAENLWEVIQYFEQDDPHFSGTAGVQDGFEKADAANPERDPYYYASENKALWCAKSSVILFTDGEPFRDNTLPPGILDYDDDGNSEDGEEHGDSLDDVAYWGFCNTDPTGAPSCVNQTTGTRDLRPSLDGGTEDPGQYLNVHAVRFAGSTLNQIMIDTAANAGGKAYFAADGAQLETALTEAFQAASLESSAASVALNSGSISGGNNIVYQGRFDSGDWTGELLALPIIVDSSTGAVSIGSEIWDAGQSSTLTPSQRKIITFDGTQGVPFQMADISPAMKLQLGPTTTEQTDVLNYIRGDQTKELDQPGGIFRIRQTVLGDLVNSAPVYYGPPSARYPDNWGSGAPENSKPYSTFKSTNSSRSPMVIVGGNDGMLHGIGTDGDENFAYIPNSVFNRLADLADKNYNHKYYVDGQINIQDAFYNNNWHTVLVSGLGAGGQGKVGLDLTSPTPFNTEAGGASKVLWEFTDANDPDLGYTFSTSSIARLNAGVTSSSNRWAAVFGNGYNNTFDNAGDGSANDSTTGNAVLYIVDIEDGTIMKKFDTGVGMADDPTGANRPNGMSTPSLIDFNNDDIVDFIFAGDLFGNMWKIDISSSTFADWDFAYKSGSTPVPLYSACATTSCTAPTSNAQPITTSPRVIEHPTQSGFIVLFGTGKYIETTDSSGTGQTTQTYYGIWDKNTSSLTAFDRSDLLEQEIILETTVLGGEYRVTTGHSIDWSTHNGWYIDLINTESGNTNNFGERQVTNSVARNGRIIFTTLIPDDDPCGNGGTGWLMELDIHSGARLLESPFDVDGNGSFGTSDFVPISSGGSTQYVATSGVKSKVGILSAPSFISDPNGGADLIVVSGTGGGGSLGDTIDVIKGNPGSAFGGRQSWRQLEF